MNKFIEFLYNRFSLFAVLFSGIIYCWIYFNINSYDHKSKNRFSEDMLIYYSYLPATFIDHDLSFKFKDDPKNTSISWTLKTSEGRRVLKFTMGIAVLQTPFFLVAHLFSLLFESQPSDGFTLPYQIVVGLSGLLYTLLGLVYLRKIIKLYIDDYSAGLNILGISLGTNLFYYATHETIMSHAFSFCFVSLLIYHTIKWYEHWSLKHGLTIAFCLGILIIIRPTNVLMAFIPLLYGLNNRESIMKKLQDYQAHYLQLSYMLIIVILIYFPQLLYWKYATGHWLYYSYQTEKFYFNHPHIIETLFGFRKGLLIYTPLLIFTIPGLWLIKKYAPAFRILIPIYSIITIYVVSFWWCWWYGGSLGFRAYIDSFPLWSLLLGIFVQHLIRSKKMGNSFCVVFCSIPIHRKISIKRKYYTL